MDLYLSKKLAQLLRFRLHYHSLLACKLHFICTKIKIKSLKYFTRNELHFFKYCNDVCGLVKALGMEYNALFVESSLRNMKAVLLNFGNKIVPIFIAHSVALKESY